MVKKYFTFNNVDYVVERDDKTWFVKQKITGKLVTTKEFDTRGFYDAVMEAKEIAEMNEIIGDQFVPQTVSTDSVPSGTEEG